MHRKGLACVNTERVVFLYDDKGDLRDKFKAKANADAPEGTTFTVQALAYSPDSTRLALAQSDSIVFVYKLGHEWNEKKSITNKFPTQVCTPTVIAAPHSARHLRRRHRSPATSPSPRAWCGRCAAAAND